MSVRWGYIPTVRPAAGFAGPSITFRRKGKYSPRGRRTIPVAEVSRLWKEGHSSREIAEIIGEVRGSKFTTVAIDVVIARQRRRDGDAFPLRRFLPDDGELDVGIDEKTALSLGIA